MKIWQNLYFLVKKSARLYLKFRSLLLKPVDFMQSA